LALKLPLVSLSELRRVARIVAYLDSLALASGVTLCWYYKGGIILSGITEYFGDMVLIEVMLLFLGGGAASFTHSKGWHEAMRLLAFLRRQGPPLPEDKEWSPDRQRAAEKNAVVYITAGVIMAAELIALALAIG